MKLPWLKTNKPQRSTLYKFDVVLQNMTSSIDCIPTIPGKVAFIEYMIGAIKIDIASSALTDMIYYGWPKSDDDCEYRRCLLAPSRCMIKTEEVPFQGNTVIASPWDMTRLTGASAHIKERGFIRQEGNYTANYFEELKLLVITNGLHHSAVASLNSNGSARAEVYALASVFSTFSTDGQNWIDSVMQSTWPVKDIRFALLYRLAQLKHSLE